jgi:HlyD family secretion protein
MRPDPRTARNTLLLALTALLLPALGCHRPDPIGRGDSSKEDTSPAEVRVVKPSPRTLHRVVEQPGTVQADEQTQLFAKLPGYVSKVYVDIGRRVKGPRYDSSGKMTEPGQLLAELSIPETEEEARQKQALVGQAKAGVEQARKALAAADANVSAAEALVEEAKAGVTRAQAMYERWSSQARRMERLAATRVVDEQTRDETNNQFRAAAASRDEARARVISAGAVARKARADRDKSAADLKAAEAKLEVARADARRLEALVGYTKIRAPYDGVVTRRHVNTGDFLQLMAGRGAGVFTVARLDPVRVVIEVPESDAAVVREKAEVQFAVQALRGRELTGTVTRTSWSLEPGARTLRAEADVPNREGLLRPGMYVYARVRTEVRVRRALPASAVLTQGGETAAFRVVGGKVARTVLRVGLRDDRWVEVLGRRTRAGGPWEPLTGDEEFVREGVSKLTEGQAVTVQADGGRR